MAEKPLRQTAADMATVLRSVLAPVLAEKIELRAPDELSTALHLARAGMAMSRYQPQWLLSLDDACAQMQKPLKKANRALEQYRVLQPQNTPKQLRDASVKIHHLAAKCKNSALRDWNKWIGSVEGRACSKKIEDALFQGQKSKSFVLADSQIDECLVWHEKSLSKCSQQLLNRTRWRNIKALGKAAQRQRLSQQFLKLLGLQLKTDERYATVEGYLSLATARRTARWLKRQLRQGKLTPQMAAAYGALWAQLFNDSQRIELDLLVNAGALPAAAPLLPNRERPSFPLQLHFGSHVTA